MNVSLYILVLLADYDHRSVYTLARVLPGISADFRSWCLFLFALSLNPSSASGRTGPGGEGSSVGDLFSAISSDEVLNHILSPRGREPERGRMRVPEPPVQKPPLPHLVVAYDQNL